MDINICLQISYSMVQYNYLYGWEIFYAHNIGNIIWRLVGKNIMDKEHLDKLREEMIEYIRTAQKEELQASVDEFNKRMGLCKKETENQDG